MEEHTRPGPTYTPAVDIWEDEHGITLTADLPGARPAELRIDLKDDVLTLSAPLALGQGEKETDVAREIEPGTYHRRFTLGEAIDQAKIEATLAHGVLTLRLPKVEQARPRRIEVKTA